MRSAPCKAPDRRRQNLSFHRRAHFPTLRRMKLLKPLLALTAILASASLYAEDGWTTLFNGKNFDGWEQHGGKAEYSVRDGAVVGKTVANTPNSFLCTKGRYGNFTLELEFKVAAGMNSGVQFRSEVFDAEKEVTVDGKAKKIPADRVHGYQYEIDPSPRAYTGGVYDEARRGWLADLKDKPEAQKAFKQGEWNQLRIECRGDSIKTWINGVAATDFKDGMTAKGLIALQVHGIGKNAKPGEEVMWKNIRIKELK